MSLMPGAVALLIIVFFCRSGLRRCIMWKLALVACCAGITANRAAGGTNGIWSRMTTGGAWSTATNWATSVVADGTDGVADFSALNITADETVHLDTARTIGQLKFGDTTPSNNWILDNNGNGANVLTLSVSSGTPTITVVNDQATISTVLSGTQGFADAGAGMLVISGANTYSGTLTINSGSTLNAVWGGGGVFAPVPSGTSIADSGALILTRNLNDAQFLGTITGSGTTTITGNGGYFNLGNGGDNVARLSSQSDLTLNIGLNLLKNVQTIGALNGNGTITSNTGGLGGNVALTIGTNNHSGTFSGVIDNAGSETISVVKLGSGTQIFTGGNTYAGGTTVSAGTLQLGDGTTSNGSITGNITDNATLAFADPNAQTFSGVISGSGGLTKSGPGTLNLTAASSYTGATTVNGGTLLISHVGANVGGLTASGNLSVGASGTTGQSGTFDIDGAGTVTLAGAATTTVGAASNSSGTINIGATAGGATLKTGTGTFTINNLGTVNVGAGSIGGTLDTLGGVNISGGALNVAFNGSFNVASNKPLLVQNGGSATIIPDFFAAANSMFTVIGQNSTLQTNGNFFLDGGSQLSVASGGTVSCNTLYDGDSGVGTISVDGNGSTLSASTLWVGIGNSGSLTVTNGGSITVTSELFLVNGSVSINGGSANLPSFIDFEGGSLNFNFGSLTAHDGPLELGASGLFLNSAGLISTNATLDATRQLTTTSSTTIDAGQTLTLSGGTLSTGSLVINGALDFNSGTLAITGAGGLTIGSGGLLGAVVNLGSGQTLNITQTTTVASGATLEIEGGNFSSGALANNGNTLFDSGTINLSTLSNSARGYLFIGQNRIATVTGVSTNAGEILLGGARATLGGAGTLTNTGLIHGDGHLGMTIANAAGGQLQVENGAQLSFDGGAGSNSGTMSLFGGAASFASTFTNNSSGLMTGHGGLIFNGGFTNQGTMQLSGGAIDIYGPVSNSGAGSITTAAGSITTFYNNVSHGGAQIRTAAGAFTVFYGNVQGAGAFTGPGSVDFEGTYLPGNAGANVSFASDPILGSNGAIVVNDGGMTEITGAPTFNGGSSIHVNNGTLRFNITSGAATVSTGVTATVASGATLELAGSVSALANGVGRVNIIDNSNAPGILVSGTNQQVGNIDGSGTTQVLAGSDLTANHIIQSALVLGGTAKNPGFVTIDASDASGNPLGQSGGFVLVNSLTPSEPFGVGDIGSVDLSSVVGDVANLAAPSPFNSAGGSNAALVPEPSSLILLAIGGLAMGLLATARRRGHSAKSQS